MKTVQHQVCLLLGSNIEPELNIPRAVALLQSELPILRLSSVWESASVDCCYPDYLNLALLALTDLEQQKLIFQVLRPLEARMGRVRTEDKNASRTIDIDIILFDDQVIDPDLWQQVHRAMPISELLPDYTDDHGKTLKDIAQSLALSTSIKIRSDIALPHPKAAG